MLQTGDETVQIETRQKNCNDYEGNMWRLIPHHLHALGNALALGLCKIMSPCIYQQYPNIVPNWDSLGPTGIIHKVLLRWEKKKNPDEQNIY